MQKVAAISFGLFIIVAILASSHQTSQTASLPSTAHSPQEKLDAQNLKKPTTIASQSSSSFSHNKTSKKKSKKVIN